MNTLLKFIAGLFDCAIFSHRHIWVVEWKPTYTEDWQATTNVSMTRKGGRIRARRMRQVEHIGRFRVTKYVPR